MSRRPHIRTEIQMRLAGGVTCVFVGPTSDDITRFLRVWLREDDAMDEDLEVQIPEKIPGGVSGMWAAALMLKISSPITG